MYLATGTGWTRSSTNNAGWLKNQDKAQIAQKVDLMTFFLMLGMGRTFGGGLYIGIDVTMNVTPKSHKEQEKTSAHGVTVEVMGPSKVSCSMTARFGYVPKDTACLLFLMIGGVGTKVPLRAFSEKLEFFALSPCLGAGAEYKFCKWLSLRGDLHHSFGESEGRGLTGDRVVENKVSLTIGRVLFSVYF
jgi:hypothetical protein